MKTSDAASLLVERARTQAASADERTLARAADCLALALVEMNVSARTPAWRAAAAAIARDRGPATVAGLRRRTSSPSAVVANAFLLHANLADDSYRVAAHPGIAVIPAALAAYEERGEIDETGFLRAIVAGYEASCLFADAVLPAVAEHGWRVTAVIAPVGAAVTLAHLHQLEEADAAAAVRLAAAQAGGVLAVVVGESDGWRFQPAIAASAGVWAVRAARGGLRGAAGIFEADQGATVPLTREPWQGWPDDGSEHARIHNVTFKTYGVAMYGQSIFGAFENSPPLADPIESIRLRLHPFAAAYGGQRRKSAGGVASVEAITLDALRTFHAAATPPPPAQIDVAGDPGMAPLAAEIAVVMQGGATVALSGTGDTSGWGNEQVERQCLRRLGRHGLTIHQACRALLRGGTLTQIVDTWRRQR